MNEIQRFDFNGAAVRVVKDDQGEPMFCLADVCKVLDIGNPSQLKTRLNPGGVISNEVGVVTGKKADGTDAIQTVNATFISEQNLYKVVFQSRKPEAEAFTDWVTGEVLPSIRRSGGYMAARPDDTPELIMARALRIADETIKRQEAKLAEKNREIEEKTEQLELAAPKVAFVKTFATSTTGNILVRDFAKQISRSLGLSGFGQKHMFDWLKDNGYMNLNRYPSQRAEEMKLLEFSQGFHVHNDGSTGLHHCSRITPKGQVYFYEKIKTQYETEGRWW